MTASAVFPFPIVLYGVSHKEQFCHRCRLFPASGVLTEEVLGYGIHQLFLIPLMPLPSLLSDLASPPVELCWYLNDIQATLEWCFSNVVSTSMLNAFPGGLLYWLGYHCPGIGRDTLVYLEDWIIILVFAQPVISEHCHFTVFNHVHLILEIKNFIKIDEGNICLGCFMCNQP